jgi:hypothetical protein
MSNQQTIRIAHSRAIDPYQAVLELHDGLVQPDIALLIFFCSIKYDLDQLAIEMQHRFDGIQVVGCTTAGEIGPFGYCENTLVGVSFGGDACIAVTGHLSDLQKFKETDGYVFAQDLLQQLECKTPKVNANNSFGFLLIDGLSVREEPVIRVLQNTLGKIRMIGGSAGDGLNFRNTYVYFDGRFHTDGAVLILLTTPLPFKIFQTQHFVPTKERLVVTEADAANRIVKEINGLPAAQEYARLAGVDVCELNPTRFAASPIVVAIDGGYYVRSIQCANPDNSLTFYCAIEEGLVLRVANGVNLLKNLQHAFDKVHSQIGRPQLVIGCECILRKLEIVQSCLAGQIADVFHENNTIGFNTYGEQFCGVHVNQTFVAVAIGSPTKAA